MKVLLTIYYELTESILCAYNSLCKLGIECSYYPLFRYYKDIHDKKTDYIDHFINYITETKPDVILWWFAGIPTDDMEKIVHHSYNHIPKIKHILFNWDDPFNWDSYDLAGKAKYFDTVFVCSADKLDEYIKYGTTNAVVLYPGYDPSIHHIILDDDIDDEKTYTCDISIICTNLYANNTDFPNQYINRKELIDNIYMNQKTHNYIFHIYGPEAFRDIYPDSYKGYVSYENTNKVFNYSKINICTHVHYNKFKYLNERSVLILGSGGLLYVDPLNGVNEIEPNKDCITIDKDNYITQIVSILHNYDNYYHLRHNGFNKSKLFLWDNWANTILYNIVKKN
jgi:hypothetical protein